MSQDDMTVVIEETVKALEEEFPGTLAVCQKLSDLDSTEYGARWMVDVYFVQAEKLLDLEDRIDEVSAAFFQEYRVSVPIISHTTEATREHYLNMLERLCPDRLLARLGQGIAVTEWAEVAAQDTPAHVIDISRGGDRLPYGSGDAARKAA